MISGISGFLGAWFGAISVSWNRKNQNKYQDAKQSLPILLSILEDLSILHEAYIFRGVFCPQLEHRCPALSDEDGDGLKMSYAQRGHQFQMIGYRLIRNCRKMIFITPSSHLPQVLDTCKKIIKSLRYRKTPSSKNYLDYMSIVIVACLSEKYNTSHPKIEQMEQFAKKLQNWHDLLEREIEKELPSLWV